MTFKFNAEFLGNPIYLTGISEKFEYVDGKKGEQIGFTLDVLIPRLNYEKIRTVVPVMDLPVTMEDIEKQNALDKPILIQLEGVCVTPYVDRSNRIAYSAKAEKVLFPNLKKEML